MSRLRVPTLVLVPVLAVSLLATVLAASPAAPVPQDGALAAAHRTAPHRGVDPRLRRQVYVDRESQAHRISRTQRRFRPIGDTPQAKWVGSEWMPLATVRRQVRDYALRANRARRIPLVAIYAVPGRDCGGYSAGGLSPVQYRAWIRRVADGLRGQWAIAVLEPDALALLAGGCGDAAQRTELLRHATRTLHEAGVWVYIDAGHSAWVPADRMAILLARAGVRWARGYSVNVSNFLPTGLQRRYADKIGRTLAARGIPGKRYLVDTSRNGPGHVEAGAWCNPAGARLGPRPRVVRRGRLDRLVWVKAPGESDGTCNGGPAAGQWFPQYAEMLMQR